MTPFEELSMVIDDMIRHRKDEYRTLTKQYKNSENGTIDEG